MEVYCFSKQPTLTDQTGLINFFSFSYSFWGYWCWRLFLWEAEDILPNSYNYELSQHPESNLTIMNRSCTLNPAETTFFLRDFSLKILVEGSGHSAVGVGVYNLFRWLEKCMIYMCLVDQIPIPHINEIVLQ